MGGQNTSSGSSIGVGRNSGTPGAVAEAATTSSLGATWKTTVEGEPQDSTPAVGSEHVYVGGLDSALTALNPGDGSVSWTVERAGSLSDSSPTVDSGTVYVGSGGGVLHALNETDGSETWRYETASAIVSSPTVDSGTVYVGTNDGRVLAVDESSGDLEWEVSVGTAVYSRPAVGDGAVTLTTSEGQVAALETDGGDQRWRFDTGVDLGPSSPAAGNGTVYIAADSVYAVDANTGEQTWAKSYSGNTAASPRLANGTVYVGGTGGVSAFDATSGANQWTVETEAPVETTPAVVGDSVVAAGRDGTVSVLSADTGSVSATQSVGGTVRSSLTGASSAVYVWNSNEQLRKVSVGGDTQRVNVDPGVYELTNVNSGRNLDVAGASEDPGATLEQWSDNDRANQRFAIEEGDSGEYTLTAQHSDLVVGVTDSGNVVQQTTEESASQRWLPFDADTGLRFENAENGKTLSVEGASTETGASVVTAPDEGGAHQHWTLERIRDIPLTAKATADPSNVTVGETVTLDASDSSDPDGSIAEFAWDFGDGTTATDRTVTHTYDERGEYEVTLTVTNDAGDTASTTVTVPVREAGEYLPRCSFYDLDSPDINRMTSTHFQIVWGNEGHPKVDEAFVEGNLANFEGIWDTFVEELGFAEPSTSTDDPDGFLYKTNIYVSDTGLSDPEDSFASMDSADGFAYMVLHPDAMRVDPPSWTTAHEFGHVVTMHQDGGWNNNDLLGPWWESAAEWFTETYLYSDNYAHDGTQYGPETSFFAPMLEYSHLWLAHGKNYYDCWPFLQYLVENPDGLTGYGDGFLIDLMQDTSADQNIYEMIESLAPETSVKDTLGHLARRLAAVDLGRQDLYLDERDDLLDSRPAKYRVLTELEPVPDRDGWWRVPIEHAPLQSGFTIVELEPSDGTISVEFEGIEGVRSDADWRVALVAEEADGSTRYSELTDGGGGPTSLNVSGAERCYLTVAATPDDMLDVSAFDSEAERPFDSSPAKQRFPYEVRLSGADPAETTGQPDGDGWSRHPNGGGYVANSASVARSAYVGSNALVMDNATVEGDAQIRDYAVVRGNATVTDQARVIEHGLVKQDGVVRDRGVVKGTAEVFGGGTIEGTAVVDGDYAGDISLDSGTVFGWLPKKEIARNRPDHPDVHTEYTFEDPSPALAVDTYGVNHGILRGNPETDGGALSLNGTDQYVLLPDHVLDYRERYVEVEVNWDGGPGDQGIWAMGGDEDSGMSLSVAGDGTVTFRIESDGDGHTIESDGSIAPDAWGTIRVALDESEATLEIDGTVEGRVSGPLPTPVDLRSEPPQQPYLGRGIDPSAPRFGGSVRNFRVGSTEPE